MKTKIIITIFSLIITSILAFQGCSSDESSSPADPGLTAAEDVTIEQLQQAGFSVPTGSASMPTNKTDTTTCLNTLSDIEDPATTSVEDTVMVKKSVLFKNLKSSISSFAQKAIKDIRPKATDGDSGSWDEEGTIDLTTVFGFDSGTIDYDTSGSYAWSETFNENLSQGTATGSSTDSFIEYLKLRFNTVKATGIDITLNGLLNQNFKNDSSGSYAFNASGATAMSVAGSFSISYRSGYAISGSVYTGYSILSFDISGSVNKTFSADELAALNSAASEIERQALIDAYIEAAFTVSGSATAKFYNAAGVEVYSETYTADELWNMKK